MSSCRGSSPMLTGILRPNWVSLYLLPTKRVKQLVNNRGVKACGIRLERFVRLSTGRSVVGGLTYIKSRRLT